MGNERQGGGGIPDYPPGHPKVATVRDLVVVAETWPGVAGVEVRQRQPTMMDVTVVVDGDPVGGLDYMRDVIRDATRGLGLTLHFVSGPR